jgi:hypothetical protein
LARLKARQVLDNTHKIANSLYLVGDYVSDLEIGQPILYHNKQFEAVKPISSEIVA